MKYLLLFSLISLRISVEAQISISSTDVMNLLGQQFWVEESVGEVLPVMPGPSGPEQDRDYDFLRMDSSFLLRHTYMSPEQTPYPDTFPEANFVQRIDWDSVDVFTTYTYSKVSESEFITYGSVSESRLVGPRDTTVFLTGGDTIAIFPLVYEKEWTEIEQDTFQAGGLTNIRKDTTIHIVDSYGRVKLPAGSFECLRVRSEKWSHSETLINGIVLPSEEEYTLSYHWISKEAWGVANITSLNNEENPNFSMASSFSRLVRSTVSSNDTSFIDTTGQDSVVSSSNLQLEGLKEIRLFPNPAKGSLQLSFFLQHPSELRIELRDIHGRQLALLQSGLKQPGPHQLQWEKNEAPAGMYWVLIQQGGKFQAFSFIWEE